MEKLYTTAKVLISNKNYFNFLILTISFIATIHNSFSQVRVPFTPRTADLTPAQTIYHVQGDFNMIGNTNLTLVNYSDGGSNVGDMEYVDVDNIAVPGNNTFNSSSSTLTFSNENGAIPDCSNIIYAGLYWSGRAFGENELDTDTFEVTKNGITKTLDKRKISLKGPNSSSYIEVTANIDGAGNSAIYYPSNTDDNMYSSYADVTDYVIQNGAGEYFVADIAIREGSTDSAGYYGGWGMVVVYENTQMKWRDITVFDGHGYVRTDAEYTINVDGFNPVLNGDVNLKLGVMAGEGDNPYGGDYFQIERRNSGIYESLSHSSNTTTNFFNSTINTSNPKNPDLLNNTGLDIVMFDLDNTGNVYINNDQTSTTFRYGSTRDSYIIFNVTFAVEAYVPEFEGIVTNTFVNGNPPVNGDSLDPNENSDYLIEIKNTGTEAIDDFVLTIPLPDSVNPSDLDINYNLYAPLNATTNPNVPFFDASLGSNGSIVWNLDTLPLPSDPDLVLADISFTLTVTADCTILNNPNFDPNVSVNGTVSGVGNVSNVSFTNDLIRGYEATGLCTGQVIPAPIVIPIDYTDYVNEPPTASNPTTINVECVGDIPAPNIDVVTDEADNSGIAPIVAFVSDVSDGNSCPETITRTYSITDDCDNSINVVQEIIINITTSPTVPANDNSTVECLADATQPTAPTVTDVCGNNIIPVITENADPVCEGDKIYTFTYTDCAGNISVYTFTYTLGLLTFTLPANGLQTVNNLANAVTPTPPTVTDNCGNDIIPSGPTVSNTPDCQGSIIYTYTYTDCAGNTQDWLFTYTINLTPFTVPANDGSTVECIDDATPPTPPSIADANNTPIIPVMSQSTNPVCEGDKIYTFTYTDCAGNTEDWLYTYTIDVTTTPTVPTNDSSTIECLADATQPIAPTITDVCGNNIIPVITENADPVCEGDKIYTYTYTDCAGNISVYTFTYTIDITTAPGVPANDSTTVECIDDAIQPTAPTVTDVCGNNITPVITENTDPICQGDKIYTYTYTDCAGNVSVYTFTYNVNDTTPPTLSLPPNVTAECSDDLSPIAFGTATATDNCDDNPIVTFEDEIINDNCSGTFSIRRTWRAIDACGNEAAVDQTISTSDTTAPEFEQTNLPQDLSIECNSVPIAEILTATDNCGSATVTLNEDIENGTCSNNFIITRTWTAIDDCGLTRTHTQTITVEDKTPPTFVETSLPATNLVVECDAVPTAETLTAIDNCGNANVTVDDVINFGDCENNYEIIRTWTATDECGLTTRHTQIITVQDKTLPTFVETLPATNLVVDCDNIPTAETLTAIDNCGDANVIVNDVITNGSCPNSYTIIRTWTATDICNLTTTHTQTITVEDTEAPMVTSNFSETLNVSCTDIPDAPDLEFTDNCSPNSSLIIVYDETSSFDENDLTDYEITRTWIVRDECSNEAIYNQTLFVTLDEIVTEITAEDKCYDDGVINLNVEEYIGNLNTDGVWEIIEGDLAATINNGLFDASGLEISEDFLPFDGGIDYKLRYTVVDNGCLSVIEVTMNINADCFVLACGENDITISKAITPNNDFKNDFFYISGIDLCGYTAKVEIFNRWGALVFKSDDYPQIQDYQKLDTPPNGSWEGKAHNSAIGTANQVPNGTYYYIINITDAISGALIFTFTGPVYVGTK